MTERSHILLFEDDNKPNEAIKNNTTILENLLKQIYSNFKQTIKLCREEQNQKIKRVLAVKKKIFEKEKQLKKQCDYLNKENQDLKEMLSSKDNLICKTCNQQKDYIRNLKDAYEQSLCEKEEMKNKITYLEDQLNEQYTSNSHSNIVSLNSSPENSKSNRLRLRRSQIRVVHKESTKENLAECHATKMTTKFKACSPVESRVNVPESCLPDTLTDDVLVNQKSPETNDPTVIPDTLDLFGIWNSDDETEQGLSDISNSTIKKTFDEENQSNFKTFVKPKIGSFFLPKHKTGSMTKSQDGSSTFTKAQKSFKAENKSSTQMVVKKPKTEIADKDISAEIIYNNKESVLQMDYTEKNLKSPQRKKRRQLTKTQQMKNDDYTNTNEESINCNYSCQNSKVVGLAKKVEQRSPSWESLIENGECDADQTIPPENWSDKSMNDSVIVETPTKYNCDNPKSTKKVIMQIDSPSVSPDVILKTCKNMKMNSSLAFDRERTEFPKEVKVVQDDHNESNNPKVKSSADGEEIEIFPSRSYKFGPVEKSDVSKEMLGDNPAAQPEFVSRKEELNDSYDQVPQKQGIKYAHHTVVRKKDERRKLNAYTCQECVEYYKAKGLSEAEIHLQVGNCSRHRAQYEAPQTPEHFWSIGFPDTVECEERGYFTNEAAQQIGNRKSETLRRLKQVRVVSITEEKEKDEDYRFSQILKYLATDSSSDED